MKNGEEEKVGRPPNGKVKKNVEEIISGSNKG